MKKLIRLLRHTIHHLMALLMPKKILSKLLSCQEVAKILATTPKLPPVKSLRVKLHIFLCQHCTDYKDQLQIIKQKSKDLNNLEYDADQEKQMTESKHKVLKMLKRD